MNVIADTNIFLAVALDEPEKEQIIQLTKGYKLLAPEILPYEIGNALIAMNRRKVLTNEEIEPAYQIARQIPVQLLNIDIKESLVIAKRFYIYAYDAYFLQSAKQMNCPLITMDKRMKKVANELNINLLEVIKQ